MFGCSPNIRHTNECCLQRLCYMSKSTFLSFLRASFGIHVQMWTWLNTIGLLIMAGNKINLFRVPTTRDQLPLARCHFSKEGLFSHLFRLIFEFLFQLFFYLKKFASLIRIKFAEQSFLSLVRKIIIFSLVCSITVRAKSRNSETILSADSRKTSHQTRYQKCFLTIVTISEHHFLS